LTGRFVPVVHEDRTACQKENYNFHKLAAHFADFDFKCLRLSDDWHGADLIACNPDGTTFLKVQLKGRLAIDRKYQGKPIHIAFFDGPDCHVYPHDDFLDALITRGSMNEDRRLWREKGMRSWPRTPVSARDWLGPYRLDFLQ
jgi:hypothetical protein